MLKSDTLCLQVCWCGFPGATGHQLQYDGGGRCLLRHPAAADPQEGWQLVPSRSAFLMHPQPS